MSIFDTREEAAPTLQIGINKTLIDTMAEQVRINEQFSIMIRMMTEKITKLEEKLNVTINKINN